jgi:hypothetical protein
VAFQAHVAVAGLEQRNVGVQSLDRIRAKGVAVKVEVEDITSRRRCSAAAWAAACSLAAAAAAAAAAASSSSLVSLPEQATRKRAVNSKVIALPATGRFFILPFLQITRLFDVFMPRSAAHIR